MRVRMRTTMAGPGGCAWPGDVVDLPDDMAAQLIQRGYADAVDPQGDPVAAPPIQTETVPPKQVRTRKRR